MLLKLVFLKFRVSWPRHQNLFRKSAAMPHLFSCLCGLLVTIFSAKFYKFFLQARVARLQVLRLFWCPRDLCLYIYIYICLSALEDIMPFIHVVLEECTP